MSCPHCRDLVATDPKTRLPPLLCRRCGGVLREETDDEATKPDSTSQAEDSPAGTPSIASFLHMGKRVEAEAPAPADTDAINQVAEAQAATKVVAAEAEPDSPHATEVEIATDASGNTEDTPANAINGEDGNGDPVDEDAESVIEEISSATPVVLDETIDVDASETPTPVAIPPTTPLHAATTPSFIRQTAHTATNPRTAKWQWAVLVLLSLLLVVQVLVADRARLAADENWRPIITRLCDALGCDVPAWHQPGAFAMLSRDVRPIIGTPGGLHVQATFRNDAAWTQDWPLLQLSLSDADGRVVGTRAFTPKEYLGKSATQAGLAPGQSARIALQLHEPNPGVVAFSFDFR